MVHLRSIVYMV